MHLTSAKAYPTVAVSDFDRARKFYEGTLGLSPLSERPDGILFQAGEGTALLVYPSQFASPAQSTRVTFFTADFDGTVQELRDKGITFEEYDFPGLKTVDGVAELEEVGKGAWFKDPDGNILALGVWPD
jgi:catechol 2,3-dioxygenase-like lactoylglutathione lyase family enzyme